MCHRGRGPLPNPHGGDEPRDTIHPMRLLQRYILGELLKVYLFVLSVLTVLLVFVGVFREARESGLRPLQILEILPFVVPSLLPFTIPATLLLTVCVVYGRMAGDLEVTAAKAAGINVMSMLWPAFLLGLFMTVCSFVLTDRVIPWAVANIQHRVTMAMEDIFLDMLRTQLNVTDPDRGYSVTVTGVQGKKLIRPTFHYTPPGHTRSVTMQAQEATLSFDIQKERVNLHLIRGYIDIAGQRRLWFHEEEEPFPLPMSIRLPKPRHLSVGHITQQTREIQQRVDRMGDLRAMELALSLSIGDFDCLSVAAQKQHEAAMHYDTRDLRKLNTEVHSRYAMAASCLFFTLLGGPFSILQGRRQFLTSFFFCFAPILIIYYPTVLLMMNLSKSGTVDPCWAMWIGNLLVFAVAGLILRHVLRH